jgi:glycosyltransferase involved in cell wall biosynthesis
MLLKSEVVSSRGLFSCIVPTLNEIDTISNFIISLHSQDYRPIELLVVDGGSTDGTEETVKRHISVLNDASFSIRFFSEKDFGQLSSPANARNIGLDNCAGSFLLFIDSDTRFLDEKTISMAIEQMGMHDYILVPFKPIIDSQLEEKLSKILPLDGVFLYRKDFLGEQRFTPTLGFGEDREFNYRLFGSVKWLKDHPKVSVHIGRHFPHTKDELKKQNVWYGKTIMRYISSVYSFNKREFIQQVAYIAYNLFLGTTPVVLVFSVLLSPLLAVIIFLAVILLIAIRFFLRGGRTAGEALFYLWYSIFSGVYFTKGLLLSIRIKNKYGRN